jgi:hypothetical protein
VATWDPNRCVFHLSPHYQYPGSTSRCSATSERSWLVKRGYTTIVGGPLEQPESWHARLLRMAQELEAATQAHEAAKEVHRLAAEDLATKAGLRDLMARRYDRDSASSQVIRAAREVSHG